MTINNEIKFNKDNIFIINTTAPASGIELSTIGKGYSTLDIQTDSESGKILTIECISLENIESGLSSYGMINQSLLNERKSPVYYDESDDFKIYLSDSSMDILFQEGCQLSESFKDDRIEYFYDDEDTLVLIRVYDLTPEEISFMKSFKNPRKQIDELITLKKKFSEIENKENVRILGGFSIGSQTWGYSTPNSDLDLRFIYSRPYNEYVSLKPYDLTLSYPITDEYDLFGWDIKKFMELITKQNTTALEVLFSSKLIGNTSYISKLKEFARECFDPGKISIQYAGLLEKNIRNIKSNKVVKTKTYIYILRIIAMINYINIEGKFPECTLVSLYECKTNESLKPVIDKLIDYRKNNEYVEIPDEVIAYLEQQLELLKSQIPKTNINVDYDKANKLLLEGIELFDEEQKLSKIKG